VSAIAKAVFNAVHALATWTAYLAAELDVGTAGPDLDLPRAIDEQLLGGPWRSVIAELRELPAADVPTPANELDQRATAVADSLEAWLRHIGFAYENLEDGSLFLAVLNPEEWVL
jgi:hypothetical protein